MQKLLPLTHGNLAHLPPVLIVVLPWSHWIRSQCGLRIDSLRLFLWHISSNILGELQLGRQSIRQFLLHPRPSRANTAASARMRFGWLLASFHVLAALMQVPAGNGLIMRCLLWTENAGSSAADQRR